MKIHRIAPNTAFCTDCDDNHNAVFQIDLELRDGDVFEIHLCREHALQIFSALLPTFKAGLELEL